MISISPGSLLSFRWHRWLIGRTRNGGFLSFHKSFLLSVATALERISHRDFALWRIQVFNSSLSTTCTHAVCLSILDFGQLVALAIQLVLDLDIGSSDSENCIL